MVKLDEPPEAVEALLRAWLRRVVPTLAFRSQAWREFQLALDPFAAPKPLPPERA